MVNRKQTWPRLGLRVGSLLPLLLCMSGCKAPQASPPVSPISPPDIIPISMESVDGQPCRLTRLTDLPVHERQGHLFVDAQISGKPANLVFDTGAFATILTPAAARRLGLNPSPNAKIAELAFGAGPPDGVVGSEILGFGRVAKQSVYMADAVRVGNILDENVALRVADIGVDRFEVPADGLLGEDFLGRFDIDIDLIGRHIVLYYPQAGCKHPSAFMHGPMYTTELMSESLPSIAAFEKVDPVVSGAAYRAAGTPAVFVTVNNQILFAELDTGAPMTTLFPSGLAKLHLAKDSFEHDRPMRTRGTALDAEIAGARKINIAIGDLEIENVPATFVDQSIVDGLDLLIGLDTLRRIHMWVSRSSSRLIMQFPPTASPLPSNSVSARGAG